MKIGKIYKKQLKIYLLIVSLSYLCATNHVVIESFQNYEATAMNNSIKRLGVIRDFMETKEKINDKELKEIFLKEYPKGLTTHYFGIIKTVLMDTVHCTFEIRWLGEINNDWEVCKIYEVQKDYT